ncbi:MAG TPA: hypothetical protein VNM48_06025 [Chloroflexota bacterium]|nr:hypothetical protein [Chloroflexota bacterium]
MTSWTDPSDAGTLDLASGTVVTETHWDNLRRDLLFLGGATGSRACRVYHDANQSIAHGVNTALAFNQERYDPAGFHSTSVNNSRITPSIPGKYRAGASVGFPATAAGKCQIGLMLNGTTTIALTNQLNNAGIDTVLVIDAEYEFNGTTDYIEVTVYQSSGGALNVNSLGNYSPEFWLSRAF